MFKNVITFFKLFLDKDFDDGSQKYHWKKYLTEVKLLKLIQVSGFIFDIKNNFEKIEIQFLKINISSL